MKLPSWRDWVFSVRTYLAAMAALYVALAFSLPRPYWAMTAVYIVSNPLSGAMVAKAFDRTLGTLLGAAGAIILVPLFVNAPELLTLAIAVWAGVFLFIALHDRTPRNYAFLLAGYTLPLIALPIVDAPETVFDVASARSLEIIVGIIIATVVGTTILPQSVGDAVTASVTHWLREAADWIHETLVGKRDDPRAPIARRKLHADIQPLDVLISQLSHDAHGRDMKRAAQDLRGRFLLLLPILSSISDRLHALRLETGAFTPELDALAEQIAAWIKAPPDLTQHDVPERLRVALDALGTPRAGMSRWEGLLRSSLQARLNELIDIWQDCLALQEQLRLGQGAVQAKPTLRRRPLIGTAQHHDYGWMLFSVSWAVLATFIAGLIWIWSGWSAGASAVIFVAISCCFFASRDEPAPFIRLMFTWSIVAYALAGIYLFTILPHINDFELIVLVLAPPFLLVGALVPRPELGLITMLLATNIAGDLSLQGRYSGDFTSYVNGCIASAAGLAFSWIWTLIVRPFGAEIAAARLIRNGWRDVARLAEDKRAQDHAALISRVLDRLSQLAPRLHAISPDTRESLDGLAELRTGYNIIGLQQSRTAVGPDVRQAIDAVLGGIAAYFRACAEQGTRAPAPEALIGAIDRTINRAFDEDSQAARDTLDALVGLRRSLFPMALRPTDEAMARTAASLLAAAPPTAA